MADENTDIPPITSTLDKYRKVWRPKKRSVKNEIMISLRNPRVDGHIIYAATLLIKKKYSFVIIKAAGNACTRATLIAEILKSRVENLHQINRIYYTEIEDVYEPKEMGLNEVKITKAVPIFEIILTIEDPNQKINDNPERKLIFDLEDSNTISITEDEFKIGYQAPTNEKVKPFEPGQLGRRRNQGRVRKTKLLGKEKAVSRGEKNIKGEKELKDKRRGGKEGGRYQGNQQERGRYEGSRQEGDRHEVKKNERDGKEIKYDGKRFEKNNREREEKKENFRPTQTREGYGASQTREGYRPSQNRESYEVPQTREGYRPSQNREGYGTSQNREGYRPSQAREGYEASQNNESYGVSQTREGYRPPQTREGYGPERGTTSNRGGRYVVRGQRVAYRSRGGRGTGGRGGQPRDDNGRQRFYREEGDIRQENKYDMEGSIEVTKKRRLSEELPSSSRGGGYTSRGRGFASRSRGFTQRGGRGIGQFINRGGRGGQAI